MISKLVMSLKVMRKKNARSLTNSDNMSDLSKKG